MGHAEGKQCQNFIPNVLVQPAMLRAKCETAGARSLRDELSRALYMFVEAFNSARRMNATHDSNKGERHTRCQDEASLATDPRVYAVKLSRKGRIGRK